jgi:hypothetical protein
MMERTVTNRAHNCINTITPVAVKKYTRWRKSRLKLDVLTRCPQSHGTFAEPYITISPLQDIKYLFRLFKQNFIM